MPPYALKPEEVMANIPKILGLGQAYFAAQCMNAVVRLGVADALGDETLSVKDLCARLPAATQEEMLLRCMRMLAMQGIFAESAGPAGEFCFALTPAGALLQTNAPQPSMACGMLHWNEKCVWDSWQALPGQVAGTGPAAPTPFEAANGVPIFQYYKEHPESAKPFNEFMTFFSGGELQVLMGVFPWAELAGKKVVDVGGSLGAVMGAVKAAHPEIECVSFDLPEVIAAVTEAPAGVEMVAGDMFKPETIPAADAIFMKHILHDWSDDNCTKILASCATAIKAGAKIYLVECLLPPPGESTELKGPQVNLDTLMMVIGGKERSKAQWDALAETAALKVSEVIATPVPTAQIIVMEKK